MRRIATAGFSIMLLAACAHERTVVHRDITPLFDMTVTDHQTAPFGDAVSGNIVNYVRVAPFLATAGVLKNDGLEEASSLGFQLVIDLRQPIEDGVVKESAAAERLGINRVHLPFASDESAWSQISEIEMLLADPANFPVLLHCGSANRAAAVWALLRARMGVDPVTALEEARAAGLTSRESFVRSLLDVEEK